METLFRTISVFLSLFLLDLTLNLLGISFEPLTARLTDSAHLQAPVSNPNEPHSPAYYSYEDSFQYTRMLNAAPADSPF